jgi:putative ABC transport system permease protein
MSRLLLISRLTIRDLQRRRAEAALLLLAIVAATTTLTLGLALGGVTNQPYLQTRAATAGPDVVASYTDLPPMPRADSPAAGLAALTALTRAPGVIRYSGPYPVGWATLRFGRVTAGAIAEGRQLGRAAVDQPKLVAGSWISADGVVVERSFAAALGVRVGDRITLDHRPFRVVGVAVTAATAPFPAADYSLSGTPFPSNDCGLIWLTERVARSFATTALPLSYLLNLRLASPAAAPAFAAEHSTGQFQSIAPVLPWQQIAQQDGNIILNEQRVLLVGSWLLGLLAVASVAVIVGGRMAEQARRVGLLKAVGGTPGLVATVLLTENLLVALAAAAVGLALGWLAAPLLTSPGAGLIGTAGAPSITAPTAAWVTALAIAVAVLATFVPAIKAARTSTLSALADAARSPRRRRLAVVLSRRLPVPLLLGVRLVARRPRRSLLSGATVCITATAIYAVLEVHAHQAMAAAFSSGLSALANPRFERLDQMLLVLTVTLIVLAVVNALFITQATALDARHSAALARALGASRRQVAAALVAAQLIPAVPGALLGIPAGIGLVRAVAHGGTTTVPPAWWLAAMVAGILAGLTALTAIPAGVGARRPPGEILQAESVTG